MDWKRATYGDRLSHALREAKLTASDLARRIGVRPQTISQAIKGSTKQLAADNHMRACLALSVSAMWLATGDGPMREPHSIEVARRVDALPAEAQRELESYLSFLSLRYEHEPKKKAA